MFNLIDMQKQMFIFDSLVKTGYLNPENGSLLYKNKSEIYKAYEKKLNVSLLNNRNMFENPFDPILSIIFKDNGIFALITEDFADCLADYLQGKKVLEVMAGRGYLSMALKERGIDIVATDDKSWHIPDEDTDFKIEALDALLAIKKYGSDIDFVIMSWPPMEDRIDMEVLMELRKVNKDAILIVIGEGGGCTGSEDFHKSKTYYEDEAFIKVQKSYETWDRLRDFVSLVK